MKHGLNKSDKKIIDARHGEGAFAKVRSISKARAKALKSKSK